MSSTFVVELRLKRRLAPEGIFIVKQRWILGFIAVLILSACQPSAPVRQFSRGDLLASYDFTEPTSFEVGIYGAATLQIVDGVYEIDVTQGDNTVWWGQGGDDYDNVVIDVDTTQLSQRNENAYGVMCRVSGSIGDQSVDPTLAAVMAESTSEPTADATADAALESTEQAAVESTAEATPESTLEATVESTIEALPTALLTATPPPTRMAISEGDGYLFLIQGSGMFAILRARDRDLTPLVNWTASDAINQGLADNHIRAVCLNDYLALYVNDKFVGDAIDSAYTTGQVGLAASGATRLGARITFDNLTISAAAPQ